MSLTRSARARLTTGLVLAMVLSAGVVLGVALDRQLEARAAEMEGRSRRDRGPGPEGWGRGSDSRPGDPSRGGEEGRSANRRRPTMIVDQVGLSEAQKIQVDSIVGFYRGQMRALHEEFDEAYSARYRELNREAREEVRTVLTEEQRVVYDSLQADWQRRREERRQESPSGNDEGRE